MILIKRTFKKLFLLLLIIGALAYFGFIKINPDKIKATATGAGKKLAQQVKKVDKEKITNAVNTVKDVAVEVAEETKKEYNK